MRPSTVLSALLTASTWAAGSLQTDWVGGPGVPGPVTYWQQSFDASSGISYAGTGGFIILTYSSILHWIHSTGPGGNEMEIIDTNGDGDLDIVSCQAAWDRISHWENLDGSGLNWARTIIVDSLGDYPAYLDAVDLEQDGDWDLVVSTHDGPFWIENTGAGWIKHQISTNFSNSIRAGDVDGDGDPDVADFYGSGRWYENLDGQGGSWQAHQIWPPGLNTKQLRLADIDGDGDLDVIVSRSELDQPQVVWYENVDSVGQTWSPHVACSYAGGTYMLWLSGLEASDLNQDGDVDIVVAGSNPLPEGKVIWLENLDGLGISWQLRPIDNDLSGVTSVDIADLDEDGDQDVMAYSGGDWGVRLVAWYENINGEGTVWSQHILDETTMYSADVASADVDADGDPDVVACDRIAGVRWYEFSRATSGWLESSILDPPGGSQIQWTDLSWDATVPAGTTLTFQVRASNDPADMGEWSPEISTPGNISAYLPDPCYYFQYRVNMASSTPPTTPMLDELLVQWNPVGIEGQPEADEPSLTVLSGNPSPGTVILGVYMPETGEVDLRIYDIAGRLVKEPMAGQIEAGHHQLTVTDLPTGCYRAVMTTNGFSTEARLTVLRQ